MTTSDLSYNIFLGNLVYGLWLLDEELFMIKREGKWGCRDLAMVSWDTARTIPRKKDPEGFVKLYINESLGAKKLRIHLSVLGPRKRPHSPHRHEEEEVFFILEGEGRVVVDDKEFKLSAMSAVFIPPGSLHGIENIGDKPLKYLVIIAK